MRYTGDDYTTPPDGFYDPTLWETLVRLWYSGGLLWIFGISFCLLMIILGLVLGARRRTGVPAVLNRNVDALGAVIADSVRGSEASVREKAQGALDANQELFGDATELMNLVGKHHAALNKANSAVKEVEPEKKADAKGLSGMSGGTVINIAVNNGQPGVGEPGATPAPGAVAALGGEIVGAPKVEDKKDAKGKPGFDTTTKVWLTLQKLAAPWRDLSLMREHYSAVFRQLTTAEWRDPRTLNGAPVESGSNASRPRWRR